LRFGYRTWTGENSAVEVGERIVFNISQGRKIFKFMKFLEPLRKIHEESLLKTGKPKLIRALSIVNLVCAFFLYISDNMVWFANMGIIKPSSRFSGVGFSSDRRGHKIFPRL
jgi:Peroxisomal biogenesis factor 11 (PEX11)